LEPHRDHVYQRLVKLEYTHIQVTILYSILNIILGILAILVYQSNEIVALVLFAGSFIPYFVLVMITYSMERKRLE